MLACVPLLENGFARSKCCKAHVLQQANIIYSLIGGAEQSVQGITSNYIEDQACVMEKRHMVPLANYYLVLKLML